MTDASALATSHLERRSYGIVVSPDIARRWLDTSPGNRAIRPATVRHYAWQMANGEWLEAAQGISFDQDGRLLDGHHRLLAIIAAGVSVWLWVSTGFARATFAVIDGGERRNAADILGQPRKVAEVVRFGASLVFGRRLSTADLQYVACTPVLPIAQQLLTFASDTAAVFSTAPSKLAAVMAIHEGVPGVRESYKRLIKADLEHMTKSERGYVRQVLNGLVSSTNSEDVMVRSWRVFTNDKDCTKIQVNDGAALALVKKFRKTIEEMDNTGFTLVEVSE